MVLESSEIGRTRENTLRFAGRMSAMQIKYERPSSLVVAGWIGFNCVGRYREKRGSLSCKNPKIGAEL